MIRLRTAQPPTSHPEEEEPEGVSCPLGGTGEISGETSGGISGHSGGTSGAALASFTTASAEISAFFALFLSTPPERALR